MLKRSIDGIILISWTLLLLIINLYFGECLTSRNMVRCNWSDGQYRVRVESVQEVMCAKLSISSLTAIYVKLYEKVKGRVSSLQGWR